jgi:hypothetical protein
MAGDFWLRLEEREGGREREREREGEREREKEREREREGRRGREYSKRPRGEAKPKLRGYRYFKEPCI